MGGLTLLLELLSNEGSSAAFSKSAALHSCSSITATTAASAAASIVGVLPLYIPVSYLRDNAEPIAYCEELHDGTRDVRVSTNYGDIGLQAPPEDEDINAERDAADELYRRAYANKSYHINLKPIYSAFYPGPLSLTVLRALAVNFQPVVETYLSRLQEDAEDDELVEEEPAPIDVQAALKGSGWTVSRELTVVTTRRLLERLVVRHVSKRTAWKLLKDLPTSSKRKSGRLLPTSQLFIGITKTTFRGQCLGIAASWLVQLFIDIFSYLRALHRRRRKMEAGVDYKVEKEEFAFFLRKTVGNTLKNAAALALSSVVAGIGVVLIHPIWGQRIGSVCGEFAGFMAMSYLIDRWIIFGTLGNQDLD